MANYMDSSHSDPLRGFKFIVTVTGNMSFARAGFSNIKGLKMQTKPVTYREGGDNLTSRQLPGLTTFPNVTFQRGLIVGDNDIWIWASQVFNVTSFNQPAQGGTFRNTLQIQLQDRDGTPARTWTLYNAWVTEYSPGDFDAEKESVFLNEMVVAHEGFSES